MPWKGGQDQTGIVAGLPVRSCEEPLDKSERFRRLAEAPFTTLSAGGVKSAVSGNKLTEIFNNRQLLGLLVRRDLQARYRDSVLGFLWALIRPIIMFGMYYVVLGQILGAARGIDNFAVYLFAGLTIYTFFSDTVLGATSSILVNSGLVKKVYVPRELFPLASVGGAAFMFGMQLIVLFLAALFFQALPAPVDMLWFFPSVGLLGLYGLAIGLLLCALNVYLRDVQYLAELVLTVAMWASPIVYSWPMVRYVVLEQLALPTWVMEIYTNNPVTLAVLGFHRAFWGEGTNTDYPPELGLRMLIAAVVGLVLLAIAQRVFTRLQGNFAQEL